MAEAADSTTEFDRLHKEWTSLRDQFEAMDDTYEDLLADLYRLQDSALLRMMASPAGRGDIKVKMEVFDDLLKFERNAGAFGDDRMVTIFASLSSDWNALLGPGH